MILPIKLGTFKQYTLTKKNLACGYGSIPINTIFRGMNIHKSQLFWCELQGYKVLTHCQQRTLPAEHIRTMAMEIFKKHLRQSTDGSPPMASWCNHSTGEATNCWWESDPLENWPSNKIWDVPVGKSGHQKDHEFGDVIKPIVSAIEVLVKPLG